MTTLGEEEAKMPRHVQIPENLTVPGTSGTRLLEIERSKASFSSKDLARFLLGEEHLERQARLLEIIEREPAFNKSRLAYLSRTDRFAAGLAKEKRFVQLAREHEWDEADQTLAEEIIDMPSAMGLHKSMFMETLRSQSTPEQRDLFLPRAERFEIIGCYAQTELGHGSNVQSLETTATYDPETQEFVLNSPSMTAAKWWSGGLGRTADHAVVMAQLYTQGKRRGPHPFIVPIRDLETRKPLPGCTIADIGPKAGYNSTDNGMLILQNVRIPHINFFSRFSTVDSGTGLFTKPKNPALAYGTMTFIRSNIVRQSHKVLAKAATVAVRYCSVRRQFSDRDAPKMDERRPAENQVIDYRTVQARIFPVMVAAIAFQFTGLALYREYLQTMDRIREGDVSTLNEIHASSSGLKCYVTIFAAESIEACRRACGGHGFSMASGLVQQYQDYLPQVTWEGDSYMLTQQTGRYLFKVFRALWVNPDDDSFGENVTVQYFRRYIKDTGAKSTVKYSGDFHDPMMYVAAFGHRAAYSVGVAVRKRDVEKSSWNACLIDIDRASHAHSQYILVLNFANVVMHDKTLAANPALHNIMQTCFEYFACQLMDRHAAEFLASGYLSPEQHELLRKECDELLGALRPQAVAIVDGFAVSDYQLNSVLGRSDGNVYENLIDFACREPINAIDWNTKIDDPELTVNNSRVSKL